MVDSAQHNQAAPVGAETPNEGLDPEGEFRTMTEVSTQPSTLTLRVRPQTLYADTPDGAAVYIERLSETPEVWLREHGMCTQNDATPVVIMLDPGKRRIEFCDTIGFHGGEDQPLKRIDEAIAALTLARAALVAAGHVDFISKTVES